MRPTATLILPLCAISLFACHIASAVTIDTVPVGNPGNPSDPATGFGEVAYNYRIGTYEVTNSQYAAFLTAVAASDTYGLFNDNMGNSVYGGITRSGTSGGYSYAVKPGYDNRPVNYVSWGDAARFANWLANGQPTGAQDASTTEEGSYSVNGAATDAEWNSVMRNSDATVVIPSENEWYKAAYYNSGTGAYFRYPTSSSLVPSNSFLDAGNNANFATLSGDTTTESPYLTDVGHFAASPSPYGTFDQGGNVYEWNEHFYFGPDSAFRGLRGGFFGDQAFNMASDFQNASHPTDEHLGYGFRVAIIPEPSSLVLAAFGTIGLATMRRWAQGLPSPRFSRSSSE